jgi:regulatory protein
MLIKNLEDRLDFDQYGEDACKKCYQQAIKILARKDYSRFKLKNKLLEKDFQSHLIDDLLDLLIDEKYLREDYYKEARIKGMINKGYHPNYIHQKMYQENCPVTDVEIDDVLTECNTNEQDLLISLIKKKYRIMDAIDEKKNDNQKREKILRFVATKGHCPHQARRIIDSQESSYTH